MNVGPDFLHIGSSTYVKFAFEWIADISLKDANLFAQT